MRINEVLRLGFAYSQTAVYLFQIAPNVRQRGQRRSDFRFGCEAAHAETDRAFGESADAAVGGGSAMQAGAGEDAELLFQADTDFIAGDACDIE